MDRRDFLKLRVDRQRRVAEISCERLLTRWLESRPAGGSVPGASDERDVRRLFEELEAEVVGCNVLRIVDRSRLSGADEALRRGLGDLVARFRGWGGEVEMDHDASGRGTAPEPVEGAR